MGILDPVQNYAWSMSYPEASILEEMFKTAIDSSHSGNAARYPQQLEQEMVDTNAMMTDIHDTEGIGSIAAPLSNDHHHSYGTQAPVAGNSIEKSVPTQLLDGDFRPELDYGSPNAIYDLLNSNLNNAVDLDRIDFGSPGTTYDLLNSDMNNAIDLDRELPSQGLEIFHPSSNDSILPPSSRRTSISSHRAEPTNTQPPDDVLKIRGRCYTIMSNGVDADSLILPLGLLRTTVLAVMAHKPDYRYPVRKFECGKDLFELNSVINYDWLREGLENIFLFGYEAAQKSIQQRQALRSQQATDLTSTNPLEDYIGHQTSISTCNLTADRIGMYVRRFPSGTLRLQFGRVYRRQLIDNIPPSSNPLQLTFISSPEICTTGVNVIFPAINSIGSSLPPQLTTFNVVPKDSKIMQYVKEGNLRGVRDLFERKVASARDVDPWGFSLLSVS